MNLFYCTVIFFFLVVVLHIIFYVADASMYAHYLFNAFDTTNNGSIKFKVQKNRSNVSYLVTVLFIFLAYALLISRYLLDRTL